MIKIYQTSEGLCVNTQDLGKLLEINGYSLFSFVFNSEYKTVLPKEMKQKYDEIDFWDINYVKEGLELKLYHSPRSLNRLSKYKKARIEYLIDYLNRFIKETETKNIHPFCING